MHLGSSNKVDEYFRILIIYTFFSSVFSSFLIYVRDQVSVLIRWAKVSVKWYLWTLLIIFSVKLAFIFNFLDVLYIGLACFFIEIWAVEMITSGRFIHQQIVRQLPVVFVILSLLLLKSRADIIVSFYLGISIFLICIYFTNVIIKFPDFNRNSTGTTNNRWDQTFLTFLLLSFLVKLIPILEADRLVSIAMMSTIVYSSKVPNVLRVFLEQAFGVNLLSFFTNINFFKRVLPLFVFIFLSFVIVIFRRELIELSVFALDLHDNAKIKDIICSAEIYFLTLPVIGLGIILKSMAYNLNGLKPVIIVLLSEVLFGLSIFFFLFNEFGYVSTLIFHALSWLSSAVIFILFSGFSRVLNVVYFLSLIFYVVFVTFVIN